MAWHKGHISKGYFIPSYTCYTMEWGIARDFERTCILFLFILIMILIFKVPLDKDIVKATKGLHRISRAEAIKIINRYKPELKVNGNIF